MIKRMVAAVALSVALSGCGAVSATYTAYSAIMLAGDALKQGDGPAKPAHENWVRVDDLPS